MNPTTSLDAFARQVLTWTRDGWSPSQIASELGVPSDEVTKVLRTAAAAWRENIATQVYSSGYTHHLRIEWLWSHVVKAIAENGPDPKYLQVAVQILNRHAAHMGLDHDGKGTIDGFKGTTLQDLEATAKAKGIKIPRPFSG